MDANKEIEQLKQRVAEVEAENKELEAERDHLDSL